MDRKNGHTDMRVWLVATLAITAGAFHLYTGFFGLFSATVQRSLHWVFMCGLVFLNRPTAKSRTSTGFDLCLIGALVGSTTYLLFTWESRILRVSATSTAEIVFGLLMIVVTLEAARRTAGWFLFLTSSLFLIYAWVGPYLPGILGHRGYSISRLVSFLYMTNQGIYGMAIGVSATYIALFVLFGAFLNAAGGGELFLSLSHAVTRRARAGAAKASIVGSALMGSISGSPVANAVTTGTFTIPMMIRTGYAPHRAAAVEAAASTGGMIMPPIMGSAAFIMAEFLQMEYWQIAAAALIPAVLYFVAVFLIVHLQPTPDSTLSESPPSSVTLWRSLGRGWHILASLAVLLCFLMTGRSAIESVMWATFSVWLLSSFNGDTRLSPRRFAKALRDGMTASAVVAAACAAAGIILGVINLTGLGVAFSGALFGISGGNSLLALVMTMLASLVLGMGLPAAAVYIVVSSLAAAPLVQLGFPALAAHMFVFYFGIMSTITPPVALTAYASAGIAAANPVRVARSSIRLGLGGYLVPFMFMYSPGLLLLGSPLQIAHSTLVSLLAVSALAASLAGRFLVPLSPAHRCFALAAALLMVAPRFGLQALGIATLCILFVAALRGRRKELQDS